MNLQEITPLILTWNEEPNIRRCLDRLRWASRIVVVDSGSTDGTLAICREFPQVEVVARAFDSFAEQCNFGLQAIQTEWALSIDADYIFPAEFPDTVATIEEDDKTMGYCFPFYYCVYGKRLRSCLYPPRTVLYRKRCASYSNDGHGHRVEIAGAVRQMKLRIEHDDRKPLSRWLDSQRKYALQEAEKMLSAKAAPSFPDRLRRMIWPAAPAIFLYTLFVKLAILDGWRGFYYVLQRTYAELLLSVSLLERRLLLRHSDSGSK